MTTNYVKYVNQKNREWLRWNPTVPLFAIACRHALEGDRVESEAFRALFRFLPATSYAREKSADDAIALFRDAFPDYEGQLSHTVEKLLKNSRGHFTGRFIGWQRSRIPVKSLKKVLTALFSDDPIGNLDELLRRNNGSLKGLRLSRFSEFCHMCHDEVFPVINDQTEFVYGLGVSSYAGYATLSRDLNLFLDAIRFPKERRFGLVDQFTAKHHEMDASSREKLRTALSEMLERRQHLEDLAQAPVFDSEFEDEGSLVFKKMILTERSRSAKNRRTFLLLHGHSRCEICGTDLQRVYGLADSYLEVHHKFPISKGARSPNQELLAGLCPNCHKAVHRFLSEQIREYGDTVIDSPEKALSLHDQFVARCQTLGLTGRDETVEGCIGSGPTNQ